MALVFNKEVVRLRGITRSIISDLHKVFMSLFWHESFSLQGFEFKHSMTYHSQMDGQSEVANRGLEIYLLYVTMDKPSQWSSWLPPRLKRPD